MLSSVVALCIAQLSVTQALPADASKAYAQVLKAHVEKGRVDYDAIAKNRALLDRYIGALAKAKVPKDRNARIGFYIDAYNALVIKSVLDNDKPRSVLDVKGFFDKQTHTVAGEKMTLDHLEKKTLNPYAKDARTHMVLVCGAVGCPILESKPFFGTDVDARMEAATKRYLHSRHGAVVEKGHLKLSKIFDWYAKDFGGKDGVLAFVKKRLAEEQTMTLGASPKVTFLDYNWTLNQQ